MVVVLVRDNDCKVSSTVFNGCLITVGAVWPWTGRFTSYRPKLFLRKIQVGRQWLTPVIPATQETEIRRIEV
jgi:hypothetical protein